MSEENYSYANYMNVLHDPLQLIDIPSLIEKCTDTWYNQTLCRVNDSVVRLAIVQGEYHWHKHDKEDEFFFTLTGKLLLDIEGDGTIELNPHHGYVVPKGVVHKTRALEKTVVIMIELAGIIPTGDV
ncbi:MAG: cupin domain-containing protein [Chloroflexi bacterium]|jgi:mannose-6-phosphate isomerase-like protein (cupin superfamily)|nr:cupin domain-containing protein [Chloroflexota bacterium]MBT7082165.1 cupin domain-containing protein [Chloroflexota bacterium]MBT7290049.1 cupin domain-containing protein [Chloroflexota bacterium]